MTHPRAKSASLTRVSKAILLPSHLLSTRLRRILGVIDSIHIANNLKQVPVVMDSRVRGAVFEAYTATGPYTIHLNPDGNHPELSLVHEIGHFLEWQAVPKAAPGQRSLKDDSFFVQWLEVVRATENFGRLHDLRESQEEAGPIHQAANYLLDEQELWARSYSQYVAVKKQVPMLLQQIGAENKILTGTILLRPYWKNSDFLPVQAAIDSIFQALGWSK